MNKKVEIIPATKEVKPITQDENSTQKRRVAAYCRVSTESDEQLNSYAQQTEEWTRRILENPNYTLVNIYADAGISGTAINGRDGFKQMIADARAGKIDLILCKSISRFARNTVLTISTIRDLKEKGVEVYFDNEHMSTFDPKTELMFSIISSMAQEESRHISENVGWTFRKMMSEGIPFVTASNFLGYDKSDDGTHLVINEEQAKIVRFIYDSYEQGTGPTVICRKLQEMGIKTLYGKEKWNTSTIIGILKNEKYCGDLLLQKTYTVDYLSHKRKENTGEKQMFFLENAHEAIISKEQWNRVQSILKENKEKAMGANKDLSRYNTQYPLSGMLVCLRCGNTYKRRRWISGYKKPRWVFTCNGYLGTDREHKCLATTLGEKTLLTMCIDAIKTVYFSDSPFFKKLRDDLTMNPEEIKARRELEKKNSDKKLLSEHINHIFLERMEAKSLEERKELDSKYYKLIEEYNDVSKEVDKLENLQILKQTNQSKLLKMLDSLKGKNICPEDITKNTLETLFYRFIVVDKQHVVIAINATNTVSLEDFRYQRIEIAEKQPVYESTIFCKETRKTYALNYKIVLI